MTGNSQSYLTLVIRVISMTFLELRACTGRTDSQTKECCVRCARLIRYRVAEHYLRRRGYVPRMLLANYRPGVITACKTKITVCNLAWSGFVSAE